ncbi:MAG: hypothetical protein AB7L90_23445 [Hyphomicrobiaceae bacterium]
MSHDEQDRLKGGIKNDPGRAGRLAAELRRNLQRRKQRSRAVAAREQAPEERASRPRPDEPSQ